MAQHDVLDKATGNFCWLMDKLRSPFIRGHFKIEVIVKETEDGRAYLGRITARRVGGVTPSGRFGA